MEPPVDTTERCFRRDKTPSQAELVGDYMALRLGLNRYNNILPLPFESRYHLRTNPASYDYFNGNVIDNGRYIATQAPTPGSIADFWLMVLETNARAVVMLTRLQEGSSVKATNYVPTSKGESITYGLSGPVDPITYSRGVGDPVQLIRIECIELKEPSASEPYTRRALRVWRHRVLDEAEIDGPIDVQHLFFEKWPDAGVPESREDFLSLVQNPYVSPASAASPVVVHCSAGVGRTGAYILLALAIHRQLPLKASAFCALLDELRKKGRRLLVSSFDQFQFVFDTYTLYLERQRSTPSPISCRLSSRRDYPCAYCGLRAKFRCMHGGRWVPYCCDRCCSLHCQEM